jgi:hypothetical protein
MEREEELPLSDEEHEYSEEPEGGEAGDNFGFQPAPQARVERRESAKKGTPESDAKRQQINRLLCRYPALKLRSSKATLKLLDQYDEEELDNIMTNAQNDLAAIRGAPMADFLISLGASLIDKLVLPGYLDRCRADAELRNDVEAEANLLFNGCGNKTNIVFRALNNAFVQACSPHVPITTTREEPIERSYFQDVAEGTDK